MDGFAHLYSYFIFISISNHTTLEYGINELLGYFASVSGAPVKIRHCIAIYCMAFILSQLYVNGLTSVVTIATPPTGFKTVKELVDSGYKIKFIRGNLSPQKIFGEEFKALGLNVEEVFHIFRGDTHDDDIFNITTKNRVEI